MKIEQNEKQAENSSISLNYLSESENAKRVLHSDSEELQLIQRVFELCSDIKSNNIKAVIQASKLNDIDASSKTVVPTLVTASNKFVKSFSEQLIVQYCALTELITGK